jgi:hypothetical protein
MDTEDTQKMPKMPKNIICTICDFKCSKLSNYDSHILTAKHLKMQEKIQNDTKKCQKMLTYAHSCECGHNFKYHSGLWRHKKKCGVQNEKVEISSISEYEPEEYSMDPCSLSDKDLIMLLINENKEFKQIVLDQYKTIIDLAKTNVSDSYNNNNSLNKTFNLQFFLNEQCKDALNLSEFVSSVTMELSDLEETGRLGYVEGVSRIINKNLNKLDVYKRPIHCSDLKRETLYIKNDDKWEKECDGNAVILKAVKHIANENIKQITEWRNKHPGCNEADSRKNDTYLNIVSNAMSGSTREEQQDNYSKIISNIAKKVVIVK